MVEYKLYLFNIKMDPFYQPLTSYNIHNNENQRSETSNLKRRVKLHFVTGIVQSSKDETVPSDRFLQRVHYRAKMMEGYFTANSLISLYLCRMRGLMDS